MSHPAPRSRWHQHGTPAEIEAYWDGISRHRALSLEESLSLEWAITAQVNGQRFANGKYVALRSRIEDLALADKLEDELTRGAS